MPIETTGIIDMHHHDGGWDAREARENGMIALIHKVTEGVGWVDPRHVENLAAAHAEGMMLGAYHFGTGSTDGETQARFFLRTIDTLPVRPPGLLLCLDWEANPNAKRFGHMTEHQAFEFVKAVHDETGRWPMLYSGTYWLGKRLTNPVYADRLALCPLWQAQHGEAPQRLPGVWQRRFLWQYTNGGFAGPWDTERYPRRTHGFDRPAQDRSLYEGTEHELRADWATVGVPRP